MKKATNYTAPINSTPEYERVCSISLTTDEENYYEKSTYKISDAGEAVKCTEEEYAASEHKFNEMAVGTHHALHKESSTVISHNGLTEENIGDFYYSYDSFENCFYKRKFAGFEYTYVYVKIIDENTVTVKINDTETTYHATRYSITYFDN